MKAVKHSKPGKRLIAAMKEVVDHVEGRIALPIRYTEIPAEVDVKAIRIRLGLSQAEFARRYAVSPRSLQEWEQGRRRPEGAVRAYLTVIANDPEAVEKALAADTRKAS
jgi:putative transcriptional regulator